MAMQLRAPKRTSARTRAPMMSDINVTPFVDVTLVLLIIFMVTAPLMTVGVPVDLPQVTAKGLTEQTEPLVLSIQGDGKIFLQETELELETLVPRLQAIVQERTDTKIYIRGDRAVPYGRMMEVMGRINEGGLQKVALLTQLPKPQAPARS